MQYRHVKLLGKEYRLASAAHALQPAAHKPTGIYDTVYERQVGAHNGNVSKRHCKANLAAQLLGSVPGVWKEDQL